jgi:peptidoglycan/xylan/chitin deacetylase (PgdA/CDA1 family)
MAQGTRRIVTTSWDDGHPLDSRLAELLAQFGLHGTLYVPLFNSEGRDVLEPAALEELAGEFEIGGHTRSHVDLLALADTALADEIGAAKGELEDRLSRRMDMFAYPQGRHNRLVRTSVAQAGFIGARTTECFALECRADPFLMPTTVQAFPHPGWIDVRHAVKTGIANLPRVFRQSIGKSWVETALATFDEMLRYGGIWHLWGHSWEIEEHGLWDDLKEVLRAVSGRDEVDYCSNGETMRSVAAPWALARQAE